MSVYLLSFADSRLKQSSERLRKQAIRSNFFDNIFILNENDLDPSFKSKYKDRLSADVRGYGYWCWKPQVILQMMRIINEDDILIYVDVGCWINKYGRERFNQYIEIVRQDKLGLVGFQQSLEKISFLHDGRKVADLPDYQWTKGDLIKYFGLDYKSNILSSSTIHATIILCRKTAFTIDFFQRWAKVIESDFSLIDDKMSQAPNHPEFIEHRHDQAIYSLMCKMSGITTLSSFDYWYPKVDGSSVDWNMLRDSPFWAKRDLVYNQRSFISRINAYIKNCFRTVGNK